MLRKVITYHLAVLLLVTNIGIPVFTHICHTQSKSWASIYVPAKSCCSKKKAGMTQECHNPIKERAEINRMPCCENQQDLIQLNASFLQSLCKSDQGTAHFYLATSDIHILRIPFHENEDAFNSQKPHGPPEHLYGRSLLISEQVFRC